MKKTLTAVALLALFSSFSASAAGWAGKELKLGVDASYAPFQSKAPDGKMIGFEVDIAEAVCTELKTKCVWVENDFDGLIPALKAKKFDVISSSLSVTEQRQKEIAYSDKLFVTPARLIAKAGSKLLPTPESLKGKRIGVEQGTTQESYAKANWQAKGVEVVSYQNQDQVYADLTSGRLDASFQDLVQAEEGFLKQPKGKGFATAGPVMNDPKYFGAAGFGLRKEDKDLRAAINKALAAIHANGTYGKLMKKYFDFDIYTGK